MANCYACKAEIVFDNEHVGRNGKKIPLDPTTKQPHDCPMREKRNNDGVDRRSFDEVAKEVKDDHGNEEVQTLTTSSVKKATDATNELAKFVDHTLKGASKVKIFVNDFAPNVEADYNDFLAKNKVKTQGAQFQFDGDAFAIALYYEETK